MTNALKEVKILLSKSLCTRINKGRLFVIICDAKQVVRCCNERLEKHTVTAVETGAYFVGKKKKKTRRELRPTLLLIA